MVISIKPNEVIRILKDGCRINFKLLPLKLHFFFSFGGFAAVIPFMSIIARQLGINATAIGIAFAFIPVFTFISNPFVGFLVDYFQNIKVSLVILLMTSIISFSLITTISPITNENKSASQFWAFSCFAVIGIVATRIASTLSSVASYEILGAQKEIYGRQRLFGTIGWGIVCFLSGKLNDLQIQKDFFSSICLMSTFLAIDIIIVCIISLPKAYTSSSMGKDICNAFRSSEIIVFSFGIVFIGILNALIELFQFWFLEDMGASKTLLGISVLVQCLMGEIPFLFFSAWFVKKLGHFLCFACTFGAFLIRLALYFLLQNPWLVLPIDMLHGVTFGLFHVTMASFAKIKAPKGMEATLLGIFGGLYNGLGYGIGSLLGGFAVDKLGPKETFLCGSMISLGCCLSFLISSFLYKTASERKKSHVPHLEITHI